MRKMSRMKWLIFLFPLCYLATVFVYFLAGCGPNQTRFCRVDPSDMAHNMAGHRAFNWLYVIAAPFLDDEQWSRTWIFNKPQYFVVIGFLDIYIIIDHLVNLKNTNPKSQFSITACFSSSTLRAEEICRDLGANNEPLTKTDFIRIRQISHFYLVKADQDIAVLFARLHLISPPSNGNEQYFFCHGLSEAQYNTRLNNPPSGCPPCVCPAIFEVATFDNENLTVSFLRLFDNVLADKIRFLWPTTVRANKLFKYSNFVGCLPRQRFGISLDRDVFIDGDLREIPSSSAYAVRQYYRQRGMRIGLTAQTLLAWYRNCSITADYLQLNFMLPSWEMKKGFYLETMEKAHNNRKPLVAKFWLKMASAVEEKVELRTTRIYGDFRSGLQVNLDIAWSKSHVGADVSILHFDDPRTDQPYVIGFDSYQHTISYLSLPKNLTICSTIFLRHLYLVPCDPAPVIESYYGSQWQLPKTTDDKANWPWQPSVFRSVFLTNNEWQRRNLFVNLEEEN